MFVLCVLGLVIVVRVLGWYWCFWVNFLHRVALKFWVCGLALISGCSSFEFGFWMYSSLVLYGFSDLANLAPECVVWCWYR